jgi:hypothetical protein
MSKFVCNLCGRDFTRYECLRKHLSRKYKCNHVWDNDIVLEKERKNKELLMENINDELTLLKNLEDIDEEEYEIRIERLKSMVKRLKECLYALGDNYLRSNETIQRLRDDINNRLIN